MVKTADQVKESSFQLKESFFHRLLFYSQTDQSVKQIIKTTSQVRWVCSTYTML